jgi:hypothetical protein
LSIEERADLRLEARSPDNTLPLHEQTWRKPNHTGAIARHHNYSKPVVTAKVGAAYRYLACANRSLGNLSARMKDKEQVAGSCSQ